MRVFLFSFILLSFFSCGDTEQTGNCIQNSITPINKDLGLPEFNALLVPGGHVEIVGGVNGIVLYNRGTSGGQFSSYVAIDRDCPNNDCSSAMKIDIPFLECLCDGSTYSILNGARQSGEGDCNARVYTVNQSGSNIQISN